MRGSLSSMLLLGLGGCNAILDIPQAVEILCESGEDCAGGFCGDELTCDDRQWVVSFGEGQDQRVHEVVWYDPDREGDEPGLLLLAGSFQDEIDFGPDHHHESAGGWDAFVVALDSTGKTVWSQHFGGPGEQRAIGLIVGEEGATYVTGPLGGDTDFGRHSLQSSLDGVDGFLLRIEPDDGDVIWAQRFGGTDELEVMDVTVVEQSPVIVGSYRGPWRNGPMGPRTTAVSRPGSWPATIPPGRCRSAPGSAPPRGCVPAVCWSIR